MSVPVPVPVPAVASAGGETGAVVVPSEAGGETIVVAGAAGFFDINTLGDMTSVGTLAAFGIVCLTVVWLRRTHPDLPRGFRVPLYPVLPILGILFCFGLIFSIETRVLMFFLWYSIGAIVLYFVYGMHNSRLYKGLDEIEGKDMGEYVAPVGEQP